MNIKDIFAPNPTKLVLALLLAGLAHIYILETAVRQTTSSELSGAREFWLTGLILSLPYLRTENKALKFITFFVLCYVLVWFVSRLIKLVENVRNRTLKQLRGAK